MAKSRRNRGGERPRDGSRGGRDNRYWIYGRHAVLAAAENPRRRIHRLVVSEELAGEPLPMAAETLPRRNIDALLDEGAVHQGLAIQVDRLEQPDLDTACTPEGDRNLVVVLDQVSDPRNIGAILRSAAAFSARAVVLPERHTAPETGVLAKAASGALERVPLVHVGNLGRALDQLAELGYWRYGLDARADAALGDIDIAGNAALVLGAEGGGLRRLTAEKCDLLARLPIADTMESLNVSAAAAVALYIAAMRA
jgi:23S rRNA (guanosine2251-2'-O)-methyltransferase